MSEFNEIQSGRLNAILQRTLAIQTGGGAVAPTLSPEIFPVLVLENDRPEWKILAQELMCAGASGLVGVAAQFGCVTLHNPLGSGTLAVVEKVAATSSQSLSLIIERVGSSYTGGPVPAVTTDLRGWSSTLVVRPTCGLAQGTAVGLPAGSTDRVWRSGSNFWWEERIVLAPGSRAILYCSVANTAIDHWSFAWRERPGGHSELG